MNLHDLIVKFVSRWGPHKSQTRLQLQFIAELRALLEVYGTAALAHESLPDTEHEHGEEIWPR
jgi:hypothetical protein